MATRVKWGEWSLRSQINTFSRLDFACIPWLGIATLWLGPIAVSMTWPIWFEADDSTVVDTSPVPAE